MFELAFYTIIKAFFDFKFST